MKRTILAAATLFFAAVSGASANEINIVAAGEFTGGSNPTQFLADNGMTPETVVEIILLPPSGLQPIVSKGANNISARYEFPEFAIRSTGHEVENKSSSMKCSVELTVVVSGTAADSVNMLCQTFAATENTFPNLRSLRLTVQHPKGQLTPDNIQDPDILRQPDLYNIQSQNGWANISELQLYGTAGTSATARPIAEIDVN